MGNRKIYCSRCHLQIIMENNFGEVLLPLCSECYDKYYTRCHDCEKVIPFTEVHYDSNSPNPFREYCQSCHRD